MINKCNPKLLNTFSPQCPQTKIIAKTIEHLLPQCPPSQNNCQNYWTPPLLMRPQIKIIAKTIERLLPQCPICRKSVWLVASQFAKWPYFIWLVASHFSKWPYFIWLVYFYSFLFKAPLLYTASCPTGMAFLSFYFYSFLFKAPLLYTASCLQGTA